MLHCARYQKCLNDAVYAGRAMKCHTCDEIEYEQDNYQKEVGVENICRSGAGEQPVRVDDMSCPVNVTGDGRKGKKIMEEYKGIETRDRKSEVEEQKPETNENSERQICKEKDCVFAGLGQPIGNFQIHGPSGRPLGICKACMGKKLKKGKQEKKKRDEKAAAAPGDTLQPGTETPPAPRDPNMLEILLDELPEVLKTIEEMAHYQERTPISQVRYLLKTDYRIVGEAPEENHETV